MGERWSLVKSKAHQRWLWYTLDPLSGGLAYAFGGRADTVFGEWQKRLKPVGLEPLDTEAAGVYERPLPAAAPTIGQANTQQIERQPRTRRTRSKRLARKPICFSTSGFMPDTVLGRFVNRSAFGTPL